MKYKNNGPYISVQQSLTQQNPDLHYNNSIMTDYDSNPYVIVMTCGLLPHLQGLIDIQTTKGCRRPTMQSIQFTNGIYIVPKFMCAPISKFIVDRKHFVRYSDNA